MFRKNILAILPLLFALVLSGCARSGSGEIGFNPIFTPLRISIDTNGRLSFAVSHELLPTPIGTFDLGVNYGFDLDTIEKKYADEKVLIVRINRELHVYKLQEGRDFRVQFSDEGTLYKEVNLEYRGDGIIILELETVPITASQDPIPTANVAESDPTQVIQELPAPTRAIQEVPAFLPQIDGIRVGVADKQRIRVVVDLREDIDDTTANRFFGVSTQESANDQVYIHIHTNIDTVPSPTYLDNAAELADVSTDTNADGLDITIIPKRPLYLSDKFFLSGDSGSSYNRFVVDLCFTRDCPQFRQ